MRGAKEDWVAVLAALERGDRAAFVKVSNLITACLHRVGAYDGRNSCEDLVQDVLLALLKSARKDSLREPGSFVAYTKAIARNKFADWLKQKQKPGAPDAEGDPELSDALGDRVDAPRVPRDPGTLVDLERALDSLPERERLVLDAVYLQGHSYEDAAEALEMPLGTLKRMQTQGLRLLRERMDVGGGFS